MAARKGSAVWKGDLKEGSGEVSLGTGLFKGNYSASSRFEDGEGTNPEELIGAAHAACYSMALSADLAEHGHPVTSVSTTATVGLRFVDGAPTITTIALATVGVVPGLDQAHFAAHAEAAKKACPVSRALAGVGEITLEATLEEG